MKRIFIIFNLILWSFFALGNNCTHQYRIDKIKESKFLSLKRKSQNVFLNLVSIKKGKTFISLPLKNGKSVTLKDTLTEEDYGMVKYDYIGELQLLNVYVIEVIYIVGSELWLINKTDGWTTKALKFLSATKKYVATYDIPENDEYKGIEVFEGRNDKLIKLFTIKKNWFPDEIIWDSDNSFIVKAKSLDNYKVNLYFRISLY